MTITATPKATKNPKISNEVAADALRRAQEEKSFANYATIYHGFMEKGITLDQIIPRVNVLTYAAWIAKGRQVLRGQSGVKVSTWIPIFEVRNGVKTKVGQRPSTTTVFHESQTSAI